MLHLLALLVCIDPRASKVDVSGGAALETRLGSAPVVPGEPGQFSSLTILTPNADMRVTSRRGGAWTLGYAPRAQLRLPNRLALNRPLLLHQMYSTYGVAFTRRWALGVNLGASVGEADYTGVTIFLGDQADVPAVDVTQFAVATGDVVLTTQPSRRHTFAFGPGFDYRTTLGDSAMSTNAPPQATADFMLRSANRATARDLITATALPGVVDYDGEITFATGEARLGWARTVRRDLDVELDAGAYGAGAVRGDGRTRVFPVGGASLTGRLRSASTHYVDGSIGLAAVGFFDRVTARVDPRGRFTTSVTVFIPPRWSAGINASALTTLTSEPRVEGPTMNEISESFFRAQTPINYRIDRYSAIEFGTVFSLRGSHVASDNFELNQLEMWVYLAYRVAAGTARGRGEVGRRSNGAIGAGTSGLDAPTGR